MVRGGASVPDGGVRATADAGVPAAGTLLHGFWASFDSNAVALLSEQSDERVLELPRGGDRISVTAKLIGLWPGGLVDIRGERPRDSVGRRQDAESLILFSQGGVEQRFSVPVEEGRLRFVSLEIAGYVRAGRSGTPLLHIVPSASLAGQPPGGEDWGPPIRLEVSRANPGIVVRRVPLRFAASVDGGVDGGGS